ncbi:MAG: phosphoadenosine phosphosulfate reductase family protein [Smithella sp.]|jgi:sulfate adenylyltransferase subunit 2|nr:phosphoadenosine phosphosulfate reductase family protein [Smithella sp.]
MDEKTALLYSRLNSYKYLVEKTKNFIENSLQQVKNPYVACSFGKDSAVMLHLVLQFNPAIPVRFASRQETNLIDNYEEVIKKWLEKGINYQEIFMESGLVKIKNQLKNSLSQGKWDSFFVGIRAEESFGRRVSLKTHGQFHKLENGIIKISPMAWWKLNDVIAYTIENNIPFLNKYKIEGFSARTTSGVPRKYIHECLASLKDRDINSFNKLVEMFPEVKEFV